MVSKLTEESHNPIIQAEIESITKDSSIPWDTFHGKTIVITGATGLIGSWLTKVFSCRNRLFDENINIKSLVRNKNKAGMIFKDVLNGGDIEIIEADICSPLNMDFDVDYIIHAACNTASVSFVEKPVETIWTIVQGTKNILDLAKKKKSKGVLNLSSLEYYGNTNNMNVFEEDLGYIDPLQIRSSYSEGKRIAETMCCAYSSEYEVPVKTVRLAQTFGPGIAKDDNRVCAQFIRSITNKQDIVLHTKGETIRNYCYITDAISAMLVVLAKGTAGNAYNVANMATTISIAEMAKFVCTNFGENQSKVFFDLAANVEIKGYNPTIKIALNTNKLQKLGWNPKVGLYEMFQKTIESMKH